MTFLTPDYLAIRDAILRDIANQIPGANVATDGDYAIRANATGAAVEGLYQHQQWIVRQIFPDTADTDMLEKHASQKGLSRKAATSASGVITITGTIASTIPAGTEVKTAAGIAYATTAAAVIDATGSVQIAAQASTAGTTGNASAGTALTFTAAPTGATAATITTMVGGTDVETDAALLARLLDVLRNPPAGGNKADFRRWALSVAGVTEAYVFPLRRGPGTVDVVITSAGGVPSQAILDATQVYIDAQRPAGMKDVKVLAPTLRAVDFAIAVALSGVTLTTATTAIAGDLAIMFSGIEPGDGFIKSQAEGRVSAQTGVIDRAIAAPAGNLTAVSTTTTLEWLRLGTVTVTSL